MILAVDVSYNQDEAFAAGVASSHNWTDEKPSYEVTTSLKGINSYIPGSFYLRELPVILELLKKLNEMPEAIVIDGYVWLGSEKKDGLGGRLYIALNKKIPVIGVAKSPFKDTPETIKLLRGKSLRPLYVTSAGISLQEAKTYISHMHGRNRIPALLKRADQLSREGIAY
ncbi:MAG: endonuclease V [Ignavibacteria bacterium]|jgi:deoxyribonuclease V|nr:endonuclease V [Ignavibacteria bacterium]MCU7519240.1 endonuclease V [Ignavibacteria bacterium]MCU7525542.1 endonuclease V [Ignavibacteria bacterium]